MYETAIAVHGQVLKGIYFMKYVSTKSMATPVFLNAAKKRKEKQKEPSKTWQTAERKTKISQAHASRTRQQQKKTGRNSVKVSSCDVAGA